MRRLSSVFLKLAACGLFACGACGGGSSDPDAGVVPDADLPGECISPTDPFTWPVPMQPVTVTPHSSWKGDVELPFEPFLAVTWPNPAWVKFTVILEDPTRVYFQNSADYSFHYDFATERLDPFEGMSRQEYDSITLRANGQRAVLGAVLVPAQYDVAEYGIQLVIDDEVHPELVKTILESVRDHVAAPEGTRVFYLPNPWQARCTPANRDFFAAAGFPVDSIDRWLDGDACYAPGWAIGRLVRLAAAEVEGAYLSGQLLPTDILLLDDAAPAQVPYVQGIVTLAPSTPNSHAAILARSYGIPFVYVRDEAARAGALGLVGEMVVLRTEQSWDGEVCATRFLDASGLDPAVVEEIRAVKAPLPVTVVPMQTSGAVALPADGLVPADVGRVGGKASNFGLLRQAIPDNSPAPALALTFDVWRRFMDQEVTPGMTLRAQIAARVGGYVYPPDLLALDEDLRAVRDAIEGAPVPQDLADEVLAALDGFEPTRRIRFRSSTNVEDSESFVGAGLYDSATGCLADDVDGDVVGPSACNAAQPEERGVLRAVRKVFASFYERDAFLERLRRGVDEGEVGMGVLVHYSVPDVEELANGVALFGRSEFSDEIKMSTQLGALPVTNPDGTALPELVSVFSSATGSYYEVRQESSLVPLGATVLEWQEDYRAFVDLFQRVADRFTAATGRTAPFTLDFEYKKVTPGTLSVKQVRPLPLVDTTADVTPFLLGSPAPLCVYQGEASDVFANHRLKSRMALERVSDWLDAATLSGGLYPTASIDFLVGGVPASLSGDPSTFPGASHSSTVDSTSDGWATAGSNPATWQLVSRFTAPLRRDQCPVIVADDMYYDLTVDWTQPVPFQDWFGPSTRTEEIATLWAVCPDDYVVQEGDTLHEEDMVGPAGVTVSTAYYWPAPPTGPVAGYTAPLMKWEGTTITGLTSQPIVLHGYWSQSHRPEHHNFGSWYIFEPRLEAGIPAATLAELEAADIAALVVSNSGGTATMWIIGLDGSLREL